MSWRNLGARVNCPEEVLLIWGLKDEWEPDKGNGEELYKQRESVKVQKWENLGMFKGLRADHCDGLQKRKENDMKLRWKSQHNPDYAKSYELF